MAEEELLLCEEPDDGNVEYKLKLGSPTMARVEHLTTQMVFRLNEGNGLAFYQIGVLDSGQVTGLTTEEILETLIVLKYMSCSLSPKATLAIEKVRTGHEGFSVMLRVTRSAVTSDKDFCGELAQLKHEQALRQGAEESKEEQPT